MLGRSWCQGSSSCVLTEAYNILCPPTPTIIETNQRRPIHLETSTEYEQGSEKFINIFLMPSAVICCLLLIFRFSLFKYICNYQFLFVNIGGLVSIMLTLGNSENFASLPNWRLCSWSMKKMSLSEDRQRVIFSGFGF